MRIVLVAFLAMTTVPGAQAGPVEDGEAAFQKYDYALALRLLTPPAEAGDMRAMEILSHMSTFGEGGPIDDAQALYWARKAADLGSGQGAQSVGMAYTSGAVVKQDLVEATHWFELGAERGYAQSYISQARRYFEGDGVPVDIAEGERLLRLAAEAGLTRAQEALGAALYAGHYGITIDRDEGKQLHLQAAQLGNVRAQMSLAAVHSAEGNRRAALRWLWIARVDCPTAAAYNGLVSLWLSNADKDHFRSMADRWHADFEPEPHVHDDSYACPPLDDVAPGSN